jgi:tetratricopeptide (TPR) repeat protein
VGVIHRDFKPHNCMRDADGRVRVLDFGLARAAIDDDDDGVLTGGTRAYMAPEQLMGGEVDARCDQFAFCVALSEAVHRVHPFAGDAQRGVPPASTSAQRVPRWLDRALQRGLHEDPGARWPDMQRLLAALRPRRRGPRVLGSLATAGLSMATWWLTRAPDTLDPCSGAAARVADVWNDERRSAAAAGMRATGLPLATTTWPRVQALLDAYAEGWEREHVETCRATHVFGEQSEDLLDRRMACLDQRLYAVSSLLGTLERADDRTVVAAVDAVLSLPKAQECRTLGVEASPEPPAALVLRQRLLDANAERNVGHMEEALAMLVAVREQAQAEGFEWLAVEAMVGQGTLEQTFGRAHDADLTLDAALWESLRVGHDRLAFEAALAHAEVLGPLMVDTPRSYARLGHAAALLHRLDDPTGALRLEYLAVASLIHGRSGRFDEAMTLLDEAAELAASLDDPQADIEIVRLRGTLFLLAARFPEAEAELGRMLELYEPLYGPRHPGVADVRSNLALAVGQQRRVEEATGLLETALELQREMLGEGPRVADTLLNLAGIASLGGDVQRMAEWAREARRIYGEHLGPQAPKTLDSELMLGMALASAEQFEEAKVIYEDVLARQRRLLGERHPDLRRVAAALGRLLVRMGHGSRAIAPLQLALDLELELAEQGGGDPEDIAALSEALAQARGAQGGASR